MKKKFGTLLVAMVLCVGLSAPALAGYFSDVQDWAWYSEAVAWAVERGITTGTSDTTFSPMDRCTKGQILTFLWRAENKPQPTILNPFSDVTPNNYYYSAAIWAYEKGMVTGTTFEADIPCTRSMTVMYLWILSGSPFTPITGIFSDVPVVASYAQAVEWAVDKGVTTGMSATTFSPELTCTRAEIVTFLRRFDTVSREVNNPMPDVPSIYDPIGTQEPEVQKPQPLTISASTSKSASIIGSMYSIQFSLSAGASGGDGNYSYKFEILQNGEITKTSDWSSNNGISGNLSGNGTCVVEITVRDSSGETASTTVDLLESSHFSW